jgi:hypothetical protein
MIHRRTRGLEACGRRAANDAIGYSRKTFERLADSPFNAEIAERLTPG